MRHMLTDERISTATITFGRKHRDKRVTDPTVPDKYILWLATMPTMKDPKNSFRTIWKCPAHVWVAAMREAQRRGYEAYGDGWRRKGEISLED